MKRILTTMAVLSPSAALAVPVLVARRFRARK